MMDLRSLHHRAMELADQAILAAAAGEETSAREFNREALRFEAEAANLLLGSYEREPARSIIFRGAATLALRCGNLDGARRLACQGLAGMPPADLQDEL